MEDSLHDRVEMHADLLRQIHETYVKKNTAYGNSFDRSVERWGYIAALVRMEDKMNRLEQLLVNNVGANDEAAEDTALDLANYAIMVTMIIIERRANGKDEKLLDKTLKK
jgi:hypothetical protein